jgi:hypothetical protein
MDERHATDPVQRACARRARRVAALLTLLILGCLLGAAAPAGAAPARQAASSALATLALHQAELIAADGGAWDLFGSHVATSGDTAIVGAPYHDTAGKISSGAAYVFSRAAGVWTQRAVLSAADGAAGDWFGCAVAVSGDTALIGTDPHDIPGGRGGFDGAAYVFTRSAGSWTQQAKLISADGAGYDGFGSSVALSDDTALVGAMIRDSTGAYAGAAYVFTRAAGTWTQQAELTAADGASQDLFGFAVALSGDTALVGAPQHDAAGLFDAGAAYVFARADGVWTQQKELIASDGTATDLFGYAVALSAGTALIGAPSRDVSGMASAGAAYVFTRAARAWKQQAELIARDCAADDDFGWAVAVSGDTALVGAPFHDTAVVNTGAAYVFTRAAGAWAQREKLIDSDGAEGDYFGDTVALAGHTALVGSPFQAVAGKTGAGAAYVITTPPVVSALTPAGGRCGARVTVTGSGFGASRAGGFVRFGSVKCAKYLSWGPRRITCRVPVRASLGRVSVRVTTAAGTSSARSFKVER